MEENYKVGKVWADKNVPVYLEKARPYYLIAQQKSSEAVAKLKSLTQAAVVKLEELLPGSKKNINNFGDNLVKYSQIGLVKGQELVKQAQDVGVEIIK